MNAQNAKDYLPLIEAFAQGKTIQANYFGREWNDCQCPDFTLDAKYYRIKPEPRVIFAVFLQDGRRLGVFHDIECAENYAKNWSAKVVKFQEVL